MNNQEHKILNILQEIGTGKAISQRSIAKKLHISLGLVNLFLKKLNAKGYFETKLLSKNRIKYILTPKGAIEKTRLVYSQIKYSFELYNKSYDILSNTLNQLQINNINSVVFYGMGSISEMIKKMLENTTINLIAIIDDSYKGIDLNGIKVVSIDEIHTFTFDKIIVTSFDNKKYSIQNILSAGIKKEKIVMLDHRVCIDLE